MTGVPHPEWQGGRVINAHIPLAAFERFHIAGVSVANQFLHGAGPLVRLPPAVEQSDFMPAAERVANLMRPGKSCAAEDKDSQWFLRLFGGPRGKGQMLAYCQAQE